MRSESVSGGSPEILEGQSQLTEWLNAGEDQSGEKAEGGVGFTWPTRQSENETGEYPVYIQFDKPSQSARLDNIILSESFTVFSAKSSLLVRNSQTFLLP